MREQNALPYGGWITVNLTAKAAIVNCRAGRAAKGATLGRSFFAIPSPYSFHLLHSKDNEMIPKIISFLLYLGAFLIDWTIQKIPEQTKMFIIISARKVRIAYR